MKYPEMMNMRYAVCDDETVLRQDIREKIALFSPGSVIVEFSSGKDLLESSEAFDIIFLDIGMENGFRQGKGSAIRDYTPKFDLSGLE